MSTRTPPQPDPLAERDPEWDLPKEQRWAHEPRLLEHWERMRQEKPWVPLPDWYVRYVLHGEHPLTPPPTSAPAPEQLAEPNVGATPARPRPHRLNTTAAMTTPITDLPTATKIGSRRVVGSKGRIVLHWVPSQLQMLDLLDVLTRPSFAATSWPSVSGAGRWARRWGHEALNSEPHGDDTLRELADAGILRWSSRGSMKRYLLDERAAALRRFGELFGFTVA